MTRRFFSLTLIVFLAALAAFFYALSDRVEDGGSPAGLSTPEATAERSPYASVATAQERAGSLPESAGTEGEFSPEMARIVAGIRSGQLVELRVGGEEARYVFRPKNVTTENFRISVGPDAEYPSSFAVFEGRQLLPDGSLAHRAALAVVNDALSMAYTSDHGEFVIEQGEDGQLIARMVLSHEDGSDWGHWQCASAGDKAGASLVNPAAKQPPLLAAEVSLAAEDDGLPQREGALAEHPLFRLGPQYDASLKDMNILMVSSKSQTGTALSSRAAEYFSYAAITADVYERQLGLRYQLQELVLIPSNSSADDIEPAVNNPSDRGSDDLAALNAWLQVHRPQAVYQWGHAMGWTLVEGSGGGTVGWAWVDSYGDTRQGGLYAQSVNERAWTWGVHVHELGHNVGASHTNGGAMDPTVSRSNPKESFFTPNEEFGTYTAATDIYNYMSSSTRNFLTGPANLRNPLEMPFAVDDAVSTPANTAVTFDPLANDMASTPLFGQANNLELAEVGQVFPRSAGIASIANGAITFVPLNGYTGQAWFSYTVRGDIGNGGVGWMHAADVVVTVGGNSSAPGQSPALSTADDSRRVDFTAPVRINPLLNDEGSGRLWAGDVEAINFNDGSVTASDGALKLISASVLSGNGTIALETARATRSGASTLQNTGYLVYTPGSNEPGQILLQYTVEDASGNQATGTVVLNDASLIAPPENLSAMQGGSRVELDWSDSLDLDFASYRVYRSESPGAFGAAVETDLTASAFFDDQVVDGTTYYYAVTAVDGQSVESVYSNQVSITFEQNLFAPQVGAGTDQTVTLVEGSAWTPALINLTGWYDASDVGTLMLSGSAVTGWADKSGNDLHLSSTSGREATSGSVTINGNNALDFTNDEMATATNPFGASVSDALVIAVHRVDNDANQGTLFTLTGSDSAANRWQSHAPFSGTLYFDCGGTGGGSRLQNDYLTNTGDNVLVGFYCSTTDNVQEMYKNGALLKGDTTGHTVSTIGNVFIGSAGGKSFQDTSIGEVVIINGTVRPEDRQNLEGYLAHKWGLEASLPFDHPYRATPPGGGGVVVNLDGTVSDPDGNPLTTTWTLQSGPAAVTFADASAVDTTVTFSEAGTYVLRLTADDGGFQTHDELTITVSEPLVDTDGDGLDDNWEIESFGDLDETAEADSDGDGLSNMLERAFGTHPNDAASRVAMPEGVIMDEGGADYLTLTYRRLSGGSGSTGVDYTAGGLVYTVEYDTDLIDPWSSGSVVAVGDPIDNGDGSETVTVRLSTAVSGEDKHFMRLKVSVAP